MRWTWYLSWAVKWQDRRGWGRLELCNPLILSLQRSRDLAEVSCLAGAQFFSILEEEVEEATVLGHLCRLSVRHAAKLALLSCSESIVTENDIMKFCVGVLDV